MKREQPFRRAEVGLLLAGVTGLAVAAFVACSGSDGSDGDGGDGSSENADAAGSSGTVLGVTATCESDSSTADNTAAVVTAVTTLLDALTVDQKSAIQYERTLANAEQWSHFPTTFVARNGARIGDLSTEAQVHLRRQVYERDTAL